MLDRNLRKRIERAFYNYEQNRKLGAEYITDLAYEGTVANLCRVGGSGGKTSNPTESKGIRAVQGDKEYLWCKVVENTVIAFKFEAEHDLIERHYFKKQSIDKMVLELGYSRRTLFYWIDRILLYAEQWAYEFKLITD